MEYVIETRELTKYYRGLFFRKKNPALRELVLNVPQGAVYGFLGPNGAGKTTTIKLLMGLIKPTAGTAKVLGKDTEDVDIKQFIGFLPDTPAFNNYLTAYEFLNICGKLLRIPSDQREGRIKEVLELVDMKKYAKARLGGFSRGMLQRIGIAQAIMNHPKLLILDEPLLGLDPHGRQDLKNIILSQKSKGATVFFSSHILSDVEQICDHFGIIFAGRLLCSGSFSDLLSETGYRVHAMPSRNTDVADLLNDAASASKMPDGGWDLVFKPNVQVKARIDEIKAKDPEGITITPSRENLEDFFFRKIESAKNSE